MKEALFAMLTFAVLTCTAVVRGQDEPCATVGGVATATQYLNSTITLKILLVEFTDVLHRSSPAAYSRSDFQNLLGSSNVYVTPNMYTPDGDAVYGSLNDYFSKMSSGNLTITRLRSKQ